MIGCMVLGVFATVGIARLIARRHHGRWAYAGGCGPGPGFMHWHGPGFSRAYRHMHDHGWPPAGGPGGCWYRDDLDESDDLGFGHPRRMRFGGGILRSLFDRVETTPTQEQAIKDAVDGFRTEMKALRGEGKRTREDLAAAFTNASYDEVLLGELFARHDTSIETARKAFVGLTAKIHEVLDEKQRERVATLLRRGPGFFARRFGW